MPIVPTAITETTLTITAPNNLYAAFVKEKYMVKIAELAGREVEVVTG